MIATQGWAKPGFFIKTQPSGFNWFKPFKPVLNGWVKHGQI